MEKRLGKEEKIVINKLSLVAFDLLVKFEKPKFNKLKNSDLIEIIGPGLIIYEATKSPVQEVMIPKSRLFGFRLDLKSLLLKIVIPCLLILLFAYLEIRFEIIYRN